MSICVSPEVQNAGLGTRMIQKLTATLKSRNHDGFYLTTDAEENNAANEFYRKNAFTLTGAVCQGKRRLNVYFKSI